MIYLGTIANAGSDVVSNTTTAAPFTIPTWATTLRLQPSAATMMAAADLDNPSFAPAAAAMLQLGGANSFNDLPIGRPAPLLRAVALAVRKTDAGVGTTKVFATGATRDVP